MKTHFDTSALLPALVTAHPKHEVSLQLLENAMQEGAVVCMSMHLYAELYANLTRFPLGERIQPSTAVEIIRQLQESVQTVDLTQADYTAALSRCADRGLISGVVYDALHLQAAIKAQASTFYTANLRDFERLWSDELSIQLKGV